LKKRLPGKLITPFLEKQISYVLKSLSVTVWKMTRPICPKMSFIFSITPYERYYSIVGKIFWETPIYRGRDFSEAILLHEHLHWSIYPVDFFRSVEDIFKARRLLAQEIGFEPVKKRISLWRVEEDWSKFKYPIEEIKFVQNILADYLVNLHIYDNYKYHWEVLYHFLTENKRFISEEKEKQVDSAYDLYVAVYPYLIQDLKHIPLKEKESERKAKQIAKIVLQARKKTITTAFALKELTKLFHRHLKRDAKEKGKEGKEKELRCPKCKHKDWEIVAYQDEKGKWIRLDKTSKGERNETQT